MISTVLVLAFLFSTGNNNGNGACSEWRRLVTMLSPSQKQTLKQGGGVHGHDVFVVGDKLVAGCQARLEIGSYIDHALGGRVSTKDKKVAHEHSSEVRAVLQHIWPSLNPYHIITDGAKHEIYGALLYLQRDDIRGLLETILQIDGINIDLCDVVITTRLEDFGPTLVQFGNSSVSASEKIFAYTTLAALGNPAGIKGLTELRQSGSLDTVQLRVVSQVLTKADTNRPITTEDLLDLEYEPEP